MIELEVEAEAWVAALPDAERLIGQWAEAALAAVRAAPSASLSVLLTDDEAVRDLNARFLGKDAPTNVLSFPAPQSARPHLGDIALAFGVCTREAVAQGKPLADHLAHLVVHGVLHLVGYDHQADAEAEVMEEMERELLRGFGVPDPYAPRDADA